MDYTITAITAQKRNPERVAIDLDGEYAFGLARIVAAWLSVGEVLSDERIQTLREQDPYEVAYQVALRFISYRARTEAEIRRKLNDKGFSEPVVAHTVNRLNEAHLLDDAQFAQAFVESRASSSPRGRRVLAYELRQRGVAEEVIQSALDESPDEAALAYEAGSRQARKLKGLDRAEFRTKLSGFLARRGFSYGTISDTVRRLWDEMQSGESQGEA